MLDKIIIFWIINTGPTLNTINNYDKLQWNAEHLINAIEDEKKMKNCEPWKSRRFVARNVNFLLGEGYLISEK